MNKTLLLCGATCLVFAGPAQSQTPGAAPASAPPKYIRIIREEVKVGRGSAHEKFEVAYPAAFAKAGWRTHYLAMTSLTGRSEAWFMEGHDSWASLDRDDKDMEKATALQAELEALGTKDADFLNGLRTVIARFREDLSYRASPPNLAKARYMWVYTEAVKPGHVRDYEQSIKMDVAAFEKAKITDERWSAYQVLAGLPDRTFIFFAPMESLKEGDIDNGRAVREALGEDNRDRQKQIARDAVERGESMLFAFSPKMSYVSKEFAAVDPEYWTPKPKPAPGAKPEKAKAEEKK